MRGPDKSHSTKTSTNIHIVISAAFLRVSLRFANVFYIRSCLLTNLEDVYSNFGEHVNVEAPVWVLGHLEHELGP